MNEPLTQDELRNLHDLVTAEKKRHDDRPSLGPAYFSQENDRGMALFYLARKLNSLIQKDKMP